MRGRDLIDLCKSANLKLCSGGTVDDLYDVLVLRLLNQEGIL